jgi:hypothetical protein
VHRRARTHPHTAPDKPTPRQQRYLRQLAEQTGTSFAPPTTKAQASREIARLEGLQRSPRADRIRDQRAVQADLQAGAGDSVRHRPSGHARLRLELSVVASAAR